MPATESSQRLTVEHLRQEPCFLDLTVKQRLMVETFVASDGDKVLAVMTAYAVKSAENARILAYEFFENPKVIACLTAYFQEDPLEVFKRDVLRAARNKKLTVAQVDALKLYGEINGWRKPKAEPESKPPTPAAPVAPASAVFVVGQLVTQRDGEGVLHTGKVLAVDANGRPTSVETIS